MTLILTNEDTEKFLTMPATLAILCKAGIRNCWNQSILPALL
jgi:hypothetical protein